MYSQQRYGLQSPQGFLWSTFPESTRDSTGDMLEQITETDCRRAIRYADGHRSRNQENYGGFECRATITAVACKTYRLLFAGEVVYISHFTRDTDGSGAHGFAEADFRISDCCQTLGNRCLLLWKSKTLFSVFFHNNADVKTKSWVTSREWGTIQMTQSVDFWLFSHFTLPIIVEHAHEQTQDFYKEFLLSLKLTYSPSTRQNRICPPMTVNIDDI